VSRPDHASYSIYRLLPGICDFTQVKVGALLSVGSVSHDVGDSFSCTSFYITVTSL
jgi:hypothetical protein